MLKVCRLIERVASANVTAMLLGESGTGKEVLARACTSCRPGATSASWRSTAPRFPRTSSRASSSATRRGAFTGAVKADPGQDRGGQQRAPCSSTKSAICRCRLQAKLLRFLQERVIERIGGRGRSPWMCASSAPPPGREGPDPGRRRFREDLYRLAEIVVDIPALQGPGRRRGVAGPRLRPALCRRSRARAMTLTDDAVHQHREPTAGRVTSVKTRERHQAGGHHGRRQLHHRRGHRPGCQSRRELEALNLQVVRDGPAAAWCG